MNPTHLEQARQALQRLADEVARTIVGRPQTVRHAIVALLSGGHCLFEDVPGTAKTLLVRTLARAVGLDFKRIQFTPDLLPGDILGTYLYDMKRQEFELRKGPLFAQIVLADELNRAPPKTQSALLEAMQERQVTLEGTRHALPRPFAVFATQNPIESEGVYPLPEAEVDRFMLRVSMGYPDEAEEVEVLRRVESWRDGPDVAVAITPQQLAAAQAMVQQVHVHDDLRRYIVRLVHATRQDPRVLLGASPRGAIHLQAAAKATALLVGRAHATDDDVKDNALAVLAHRILLRPDAEARGARAEDVVADALARVPTPPVPRVAV